MAYFAVILYEIRLIRIAYFLNINNNMIISVFNKDASSPSKYSFTETLVQLGRNPSGDASVLVDSHTISRNHLKARLTSSGIQIMDLNSSNLCFTKATEHLEENNNYSPTLGHQ